MYYIIETAYIGPNQSQNQYVDADYIVISTIPARTNMSREICTEGWCGTTNGWCVIAHGQYDTIDAARAAITEKFGDTRDCDANGDPFEVQDEGAIEVYKPGKYTPLGRDASLDWVYDAMVSDITADTSDEQITHLVQIYEAVANDAGYTLDHSIERDFRNHRQELRG